MQPFETARLLTGPVARRGAIAAVAAGLLAALMAAFAAPAFTPGDQPTGWVTRPALSSNDLRSGSESIFRADYKAGLWTGTIAANHINATGDVKSTSPWTAKDTASALAAVSWDTGRRIVTRNAAGTSVAFRWSSLTKSQQDAIGNEKLLKFIRGERTNEAPNGDRLRTRYSVQGDTLHSTLLHWRHTSGEKRLYVGANDGMLHAFDASNGSEVFAYIPSMLIPRLSRLAANPYVHTPYVDGGLTIADVALASGTKTLLAGALGAGGQGLFMLDVTSPTPATEAVAAGMIKWEITPASSGFANLGYTYAAPRLARMNDGSAAVVVGNGYLNSGNGRATLLIINADTGALIREIDTGSGDTTSPNGLSTATLVDTNLDGKADFAYAGDIDGNLWRFDLTAGSSGSWSVSKLLATEPAQAITVAPVVTAHPSGGRMVLFGTGRIFSEDDAEDTSDFFAYGVWDGAPAENVSWLGQSYTELSHNGNRLRTLTSHAPDWGSGGHRGWRLTLPNGERVVGDGQFISDDRYYFTATNPSVDSSSASGADGENWLMEVNVLTGGGPAAPIFDVDADGNITSADNVNGAVIAGKFLGEGVSSQAVLADQTKFSQTLFNRQSDVDFVVPPVVGEPGVSGGHFDLDFYFTSGTSFGHVKHTHQYDDKYNVTGANFLNASDATYNLGSKLSTSVNFKVLVMNQYLNPASLLSVGGGAFVNVKNYGTLATTSDAETALASLTSYKLPTVGTLTWKMPVDGFKAKDWWGDGGVARAGLIPTKTGCVVSVTSSGGTGSPGPNGERHNGALTIQIIKDTTPASALELNHSGGDVKYGWRVKAADFTTYVLAEYTAFWHHPSGTCYGAAGWVPDPARSTPGRNRPKAVAAGSADPNESGYTPLPSGVTVSGTSVTITGSATTIVVSYSDKKTSTTVITNNGDGSETVTVTDRDGTVTNSTRMSAGSLGQAPDETLQVSRRINWREVLRP